MVISRAAGGEVSTIMLPYALPLMRSWWPKGPLFPPHKRGAALSSKCLPFPKITDPGAPPIRTERHVPNSIATLRREIAVRLAALLDRCPCCSQPRSNRKNRDMFDAVGLVSPNGALAVDLSTLVTVRVELATSTAGTGQAHWSSKHIQVLHRREPIVRYPCALNFSA